MKFRNMHMGETVVIAKMAYQEALKLLELPMGADAAAIKTAYRKAALKHHTDRGGDEEMMKKVNEAYEVLQGGSSGSGGGWTSTQSPEDRQAERKARQEKYTKAADVVVEQLKRDFKPELFDKFFEEKTGKKYTHKIDWHGKETVAVTNSAGVKVEWAAEDKSTSFTLVAYVDMFSVVYPTPALGGGINYDDIGYDMLITTTIFHDNRKVKFTQQNYQRSQLKSVLYNPELLFPSKKMAAMMGGKEKARKFSKRDMLLGIEKKLGGKVRQGQQPWAYVPLGQGFTFEMYRYVFSGYRRPASESIGLWMPSILRSKDTVRLKSMTIQESEALLDALFHVQKQVANETDGEKIKHVLETELAKIAVKPANANKETVISRLKMGQQALVTAWKEDTAPQIILLMGFPASGKSTFVKTELVKYYNHKIPHMSDFAVLNSDNVLRKFQYEMAARDFAALQKATQDNYDQLKPQPYLGKQGTVTFDLSYDEFEKLPNLKAFFLRMYKPFYASFFGERPQAQDANDILTDKKIKEGDVVILDSTGANSKKFLSLFENAKNVAVKNGLPTPTTSVVWLDISMELALKRDAYRGETQGRSVGEKIIKSYESLIPAAYKTYQNSDFVDRTLKFKWAPAGDSGVAGKFNLVHDEKKYPKKGETK